MTFHEYAIRTPQIKVVDSGRAQGVIEQVDHVKDVSDWSNDESVQFQAEKEDRVLMRRYHEAITGGESTHYSIAMSEEGVEQLNSLAMATFHAFHIQGRFENSLNASFIALIPKKGGASDVKDSRPITLIASECVDTRLRSGVPGVLCKLDVEKAYDHVSRKFFLYLMDKMGFGDKWRCWIEAYISLVRFSVMVNGSPTGFFGSSRGLRQGDPLSPFLFIIVMEALSRLMRRAVELGFIKGFMVGGGDVHHMEISHLLFVDDTSVFCEAERNVGVWDLVIERVQRRLAGWKKQYLSKGGKVTLLKSTLSSLPTYFLSLFQIPTGVASSIERLQRNFLWGGLQGEFKYHLVRWEQVCRPIQAEGLGIRRLVPFNRTLLGKWLWRFEMERHRLWRRVILCRFGEETGGWCSCLVRIPVGVGVWKFIRKGWNEFSKHIRFRVQEGRDVRFLGDLRCGDCTLACAFPRLLDSGRVTWDVRFMRVLQDWELDDICELLDRLYRHEIRGRDRNSLVWVPASRGMFEVRSYFRCLSDNTGIMFP
ncbi:uncharacterized protein LOC132266242 [Cornus florida]|uniref:uncharacterized protein LOC132266242 n=1 Tax=Cornus florida TaxID=4283 RepID=UPI0028973AF5|nr:uncharacterized protein LOC132266242 [Cornus florida]